VVSGAPVGACVLLALFGSAWAQAPSVSQRPAVRSSLVQRHHGAHCHSPGSGVVLGGRCRWSTIIEYYVLPGAKTARLTLRHGGRARGEIAVRPVRRSGAYGSPVDAAEAGDSVRFDVLPAIPQGGGRVALAITGGSAKRTARFRSAALRVRGTTAPVAGASTGTPAPPGVATPGSGAGGDASSSQPTTGGGTTPDLPTLPPTEVVAAPPTNGSAVWVSRAELQSRPTSGPLWNDLKAAADSPFGTPNISAQDSNHDVLTLASALVYGRTGNTPYRVKTADAISKAIGTEQGGRTLALGRNLAGYVVAADLIDLKTYSSTLYKRFRTWLSAVRTEVLDGTTLIQTHEERPNNWGAMAGASRIAADLYLGDTADLNRAATVFRGYTGDRSAYAGFQFGDPAWQGDPASPVPIDLPGATISGFSVDGALPDDMRRGCDFQLPPCVTQYTWEAMQGILLQADLLSHHGYPAFAWTDNAVYRAARFLRVLDLLYGGWWVQGDDVWQPSIIDHAYGPVLPSNGTGAGKIFGWTNWVYGT
jgi:hypothetical protein